MAEMMDVADSSVPKLNSRFERAGQRAGQQAGQRGSEACSSREEASEDLPQLDIDTAYRLVAMAKEQVQQERASLQRQAAGERQAGAAGERQAGVQAAVQRRAMQGRQSHQEAGLKVA